MFVKLVHTEKSTGEQQNPDSFWTLTFNAMHKEFCKGVDLEDNLMVKYANGLGNRCATGLAVKIARAVRRPPHELFPEAPVPVPANNRKGAQTKRQVTPVSERKIVREVTNICGAKHDKFDARHFVLVTAFGYQFEEGEIYGEAACAGCATRFGKTEREGVMKRVGAKKENNVRLCHECWLGNSTCFHCWCHPCWQEQVQNYQSPVSANRGQRKSKRGSAENSSNGVSRSLFAMWLLLEKRGRPASPVLF